TGRQSGRESQKQQDARHVRLRRSFVLSATALARLPVADTLIGPLWRGQVPNGSRDRAFSQVCAIFLFSRFKHLQRPAFSDLSTPFPAQISTAYPQKSLF
ncbi:MAG: hypothetical protein AAGB28_19785, partial [Pseudomonadota bacterium]